ncbi:MAG: LPXTG cell wall anchor domain-containing protein [Oscillospiraceae bacterium]
MTAMAIQALASYYENAQVKAAVDAALTFLAGVQNDDATFSEIPGTDASAESTAQVIVALTALGIDPTADSRFVKSGVSVVDALCGFYVTGGGFRHLMADETVDGMATEQGYYALAAYHRLLAQKTSLYDMSDVTVTVTPDQPVTPQPAKPDTPRTGDESPVLVWMGMAALAGAAVLLMQNKKKRA